MGTFEMNTTYAQTVKKVYENGDADIETTLGDTKMTLNGNELPAGPRAAWPRVPSRRAVSTSSASRS